MLNCRLQRLPQLLRVPLRLDDHGRPCHRLGPYRVDHRAVGLHRGRGRDHVHLANLGKLNRDRGPCVDGHRPLDVSVYGLGHGLDRRRTVDLICGRLHRASSTAARGQLLALRTSTFAGYGKGGLRLRGADSFISP